MADITLTDLTSLANDTSATNSINNNFQTVEDVINDEIVHTTGGNNVMSQDLDMNSNDILNGGSARFTTVIIDGVLAQAENTFSDSRQIVYTNDSSSFDVANGNIQTRTAAGNETIEITMAPSDGSILIVDYIPGAHTITFGTSIDNWVGGTAPSTIEALHRFVFTSTDGGTTITGQSVGGIS